MSKKINKIRNQQNSISPKFLVDHFVHWCQKFKIRRFSLKIRKIKVKYGRFHFSR